ncbi:MAG: CHASE2 domain-containing protein, partial [Treponema sp.]|nr:CHASE2 domain-containing protein [Treponema sp.]
MAKSKTQKKSSFFKSYEFLVFSIISLILGIFVFTSLPQKMDYRIYDFLLSLHKAPAESKDILFVNIDDESINAMGEWPWSRDILADSLIRMKELGAAKAIFDIEYLSPSPKGAMPGSETYLENAFTSTKEEITSLINDFSSSISQGYVSRGEASRVSKEMISNYINPSLNQLEETVSANIYRDNDDYFARALQFFGDAWLTINTRDVSITLSEEDKLYAEKRMLLRNVSDPNKYVLADNQYTKGEQYVENEMGFSPALNMLLRRANGAGFTNVIIDTDGIRRRIELLYDYNNAFLAQLSFAPLLDILDAQSLERTRFGLFIRGALFPGKDVREDVRIPLDGHGRMCINWLHKEQGSSFRNESVLFLKELDSLEENIVTLLTNISLNEIRSASGAALSYVGRAKELLGLYDSITDAKNYLLEKCLGYDEDGKLLGEITADEYAEYLSMRSNFFKDVKSFIEENHLDRIVERVETLIKSGLDSEPLSAFVQVMQDQFEILKESSDLYDSYFTEMSGVYKGAICFLGNTASSTTDLGTNPFVRSYPNVGTHANVMNTILQKDFIMPLPRELGYIVVVLILFFVTMLVHGTSDIIHNTTIVAVSLLIIFSIVGAFIFANIYIPLFTILLFIVSNFIASLSVRLLASSNERRFIKNAFSTYLSASVVDELIESPDKLQLGGETRNISALFTDIKSFSSMSELVTPQELVSILNEYLGELSNKILEYNGTIDKYIGDAIVSFFGAPIALPD